MYFFKIELDNDDDGCDVEDIGGGITEKRLESGVHGIGASSCRLNISCFNKSIACSLR